MPFSRASRRDGSASRSTAIEASSLSRIESKRIGWGILLSTLRRNPVVAEPSGDRSLHTAEFLRFPPLLPHTFPAQTLIYKTVMEKRLCDVCGHSRAAHVDGVHCALCRCNSERPALE